MTVARNRDVMRHGACFRTCEGREGTARRSTAANAIARRDLGRFRSSHSAAIPSTRTRRHDHSEQNTLNDWTVDGGAVLMYIWAFV